MAPLSPLPSLTPRAPTFDRAQALECFEMMLLLRRFEERVAHLYGLKKIGGFCHLYIGQEAIATGVRSVMEKVDTMITAYRDHGHMLVCGMDPGGVMAELTGRAAGYSKGKGGSMHMFSREKNFFGGHGIVGAHVPIGTGIGFAHKYKKDGGVCIVFLGDGASNQGQFFESMNMAALWKLPVLYIIENNGYAIGTCQNRACAGGDLAKRGASFGIPGSVVDGMDVLAMRQATFEKLTAIRGGEGPQLIEADTYRYRGHSMSDPATYRPRSEVTDMRNTRDPLEQFKKILHEKWNVNEDDITPIEARVKASVQRAEKIALESPEPDPSELWTDILKEG